MRLEDFTIGSTALCAALPLPVSTFTTLRSRDGLLCFTHPLSDERKQFSLQDALRVALALKLKDLSLPSRDCCIIASAAEVLAPAMARQRVEFCFAGGALANATDANQPAVVVPMEPTLICLSNAFTAHMVAAHGGPAAAEALADFDQRRRALRGL